MVIRATEVLSEFPIDFSQTVALLQVAESWGREKLLSEYRSKVGVVDLGSAEGWAGNCPFRVPLVLLITRGSAILR
jgi:hypothetical protein